MKKRWLAVAAVLLALVMFAWGSGGRYNRIARELGVNLGDAAIELEQDTHGGFHNDGLLLLQLWLPGDGFTNAEGWHSLPMDEETETLFYEVHGDIAAFLPKLDEGYYFVRDRGDEKDGPMLSRASYNFTIALYDPASGMLYYCALDT